MFSLPSTASRTRGQHQCSQGQPRHGKRLGGIAHNSACCFHLQRGQAFKLGGDRSCSHDQDKGRRLRLGAGTPGFQQDPTHQRGQRGQCLEEQRGGGKIGNGLGRQDRRNRPIPARRALSPQNFNSERGLRSRRRRGGGRSRWKRGWRIGRGGGLQACTNHERPGSY